MVMLTAAALSSALALALALALAFSSTGHSSAIFMGRAPGAGGEGGGGRGVHVFCALAMNEQGVIYLTYINIRVRYPGLQDGNEARWHGANDQCQGREQARCK
jgi:hypothetical protein